MGSFETSECFPQMTAVVGRTDVTEIRPWVRHADVPDLRSLSPNCKERPFPTCTMAKTVDPKEAAVVPVAVKAQWAGQSVGLHETTG